MEDIYSSCFSCLPDRGIPPPKKKGFQIIYLFRSCSDHVCVEQQHCLDGILDHRSDGSSLNAGKSHPMLTCLTWSYKATRLQGCTAGGRMGSWSGGAAYWHFIAQCRLRSIRFTASWMVYITTSFKNTCSKYLRVNNIKCFFVFLLYVGICWICAMFGCFVGMATLDQLLKVMAPQPQWYVYVHTYRIYRWYLHRLFPKSLCKFSPT